MEEQIERAKKMGLPTGDLQKLLIEAKGGTVSETKSSKKSGKRHDGSSRQSKGAGRDTRGKSRSATGQKSGSRHHRKK